jgi:hypothetical protein
MKVLKASMVRFFFASLVIMLLVFGGSVSARPLQKQIMEYYIYYRPALAQQIHQERYEHAFATWEDAEKARQQAALDTHGDAENFLNNTFVKEVPTGRYETSSPEPSTTQRAPATSSPASAPAQPGTAKEEPQVTLRDGTTGGLTLRTGSEAGLRLRDGSTSKRSSATPPIHIDLDNEQDLQRVRERVSELQSDINVIQSSLRMFSKSLLLNNSELKAWAQTVDKACNDAWSSGKDMVQSLFFEYSMLGLEKSVQKRVFGELDKIVKSTDPEMRSWLGEELMKRNLEFNAVKHIVDMGLSADGFADLLGRDDDMLKKSLDALLFVNDLMEATGLSKVKYQKTAAGFHFKLAAITGEAITEASAVATSWFSINRLTGENEQYALQIESLSYRMNMAQKEMACLKSCLKAYDDGCLDKCAGKTRFSAPPPPLK